MSIPFATGSPATGDPTLRRAARTGGWLALTAAALMVVSGWVTLLSVGSSLLLAVVIIQLARMRAAGPGRRAVIGLALWTIYYLMPVSYGLGLDTAGITALTVVQGLAAMAIGIAGPLMAGTAIVRAGVLTGWRRWTPLGLGVVQTVAITGSALGLSFLTSVFFPLILALTIALGVALLTARPTDGRRSESSRS